MAILLEELEIDFPAGSLDLASRYLAFLWLAFDPTTKRFSNCLSYERQWQEPEGSEDSHGRALWGLGTVLGRSKDAGLRGAAGRLLELAVPAAVEFRSPRACAFALLGLDEYLESFPGDRAAANAANALGDRLLESYRANSSKDWKWFEDALCILQCSIAASTDTSGKAQRKRCHGLGRPRSARLADKRSALRTKGHFVPIGSHGFYSKKTEKARFDQQPIEACAAVSACLEAYRATGKRPLAERGLVGLQLVPRR